MLLRTRVKRGLASAQAALTLATGPLMAASSSTSSPSTQASPVDEKPSSSILAVAAEGFRPLLSRTDEQDESVSISEHPLSDSAPSAPAAAPDVAAAATIQQLQDLVRAMQRKMDDINMEKESWRQQYFAAIDQIASKPVVKSADVMVGPDTDEMDAKVRDVETVHAEVVNGLRDEIERLQTDLKAAQTAADAAKSDQMTEQGKATSLADQLALLKEQYEKEVNELREQLKQADSRARSALATPPVEITPSLPEPDHDLEPPAAAPAPSTCAAAIQTDPDLPHADRSIELTTTACDAELQTDLVDAPVTPRSVADASLQTDASTLTDIPLAAPAPTTHDTATQTDDDSGLPNPEAIQALEKLLVVQHEQDLAAVRQDHARSLDQLTRQHERVVADLREEHARDIEVQAKKHEWSVMEVRRRVRDEHAAQLDAVERAHVEAVGKVREEMARERAVVEEEHAQAMAAVRAELRQVQQKGEEFQERLRIYETQMRTLADESRDAALLRDQIQKLTAALLSAEARAAAALKDGEERVAEYQAAHDTVKLLLDQRSVQCAQLESTVAGMTNDLAHLKADLESANAASAQAASDVATARTALSVHRRDLATATRRIAELEAQIDSERAALAEAVARAEASAADLRAQFTAVEEYAQSLAAEVQRARAEREEALRDAEDAREEVQRAHGQLRHVEAQIVEMQHEITVLEVERDRARELDATIAQLHNQVGQQAREIEDLQTREIQYKNVNKSLKDELRKFATRTASLPGTPTKSVGSPRSMHSELSWPPTSTTHAATPTAGQGSGHEGAASFRSASPSRSPLLTNVVRGHHAAGWPGGTALAGDVREVNVTYLKSVLWSFLEKRAMRTQLVPVLRALLACTEDEMRRLQTAVDQQGATHSFLPNLFS
ncbi:hypothetical protein GGF31_001257 [Allomyces arbusculus]|nr:hypothetical protein GGF31_001257 [Allomyces arbusculus]